MWWSVEPMKPMGRNSYYTLLTLRGRAWSSWNPYHDNHWYNRIMMLINVIVSHVLPDIAGNLNIYSNYINESTRLRTSHIILPHLVWTDMKIYLAISYRPKIYVSKQYGVVLRRISLFIATEELEGKECQHHLLVCYVVTFGSWIEIIFFCFRSSASLLQTLAGLAMF